MVNGFHGITVFIDFLKYLILVIRYRGGAADILTYPFYLIHELRHFFHIELFAKPGIAADPVLGLQLVVVEDFILPGTIARYGGRFVSLLEGDVPAGYGYVLVFRNYGLYIFEMLVSVEDYIEF